MKIHEPTYANNNFPSFNYNDTESAIIWTFWLAEFDPPFFFRLILGISLHYYMCGCSSNSLINNNHSFINNGIISIKKIMESKSQISNIII